VTRTIRISVPADDEGFIALRCASCAGSFKLTAADVEQHNHPDIWCPLCGLRNETAHYLSPEILEVAQAHAVNLAAELLNDSVTKLERSLQGTPGLTMKTSRIPKKPVSEIRAITDLAIVQVSCCDKGIKLPFSSGAALFYCPFCGQAQD
jgi:hypothetical protein